MTTPRSSRMRIKLVDSAINPRANTQREEANAVRYRKAGTRELFKVWIYLDGPDVPFVQSVVYELHPSFVQPVHTVTRTPSNPSCAMIIWTWGIFEVKATLQLKSGASIELMHKLGYDRLFSKEGVTFVQEESEA